MAISTARASVNDMPPTRCTVLITHANPEDNVIARWLAARLIAAGYQVWVDVRSLRGGEDFWDVIEDQLRHHAMKQIVLISPHIRKPGVKKELALGDYIGKQLSDPEFMIPVRVSDVAHGEFPPELVRRNAIDAFPNWASALQPLLDVLAEAQVLRAPGLKAELLAEIVAAQEVGRLTISPKAETLLSNWFELWPKPPMMRLFAAKGTVGQVEAWLKTTRIPHVLHSGLIGTFCDPATFAAAGDKPPSLNARFWLSFEDLVHGREVSPFRSRSESRRQVVSLLRQHWDMTMARRGLAQFEYAAGNMGWFFPDDLLDGPVKLQLAGGRRINRVLSGKFKERRWHLCLVSQPRLWPRPMLRIHANVALSLDGRTPLPGQQTQRIRMRLTRSWWNNKWRDLLLAGMGWLADGGDRLNLAAGHEPFGVCASPLTATFPVSYNAEEARASEENELGEVELSEELDEEDDEDTSLSEGGGER